MENFINEFWTIASDLLPYIGSLLTALISFVCLLVNNRIHKKKEKALTDALEQARSNETYCICPNCGEKLPLSKITFYLPGERKDNNLNGIDDDLEK